jgi:hypothetical protein
MLELLVTAVAVLGAGLLVNVLGPRLGRDDPPRRSVNSLPPPMATGPSAAHDVQAVRHHE